MANLANIRTQLKTVLEETGHFQKVFAYEPNRFAQLPAASIFFDGFEQSPRTFESFEVRWRFVIRIYSLIHDAEKSQQDMDLFVHDVIDQLRANFDLGGTAFLTEVASGDIFVSLDKNTPHLMAEIGVVVITHEDEP
jgi:hypothetical protein